MKLWPHRPRGVLRLVAAALVIGAIASPAVSGQGAASIDVSASVTGCQKSGGGISCQVAVSFGTLADADYYTAKVTAPGGSTQRFGRVPAGSVTLPVAYTGNGDYTVTIAAYDENARVAESSSG